jgi:hypothetical protein
VEGWRGVLAKKNGIGMLSMDGYAPQSEWKMQGHIEASFDVDLRHPRHSRLPLKQA